jgi:hypothetical protein
MALLLLCLSDALDHAIPSPPRLLRHVSDIVPEAIKLNIELGLLLLAARPGEGHPDGTPHAPGITNLCLDGVGLLEKRATSKYRHVLA